MKDNLHNYRVCFRKKGDGKEVVMNIGVDDPQRLEKIVMDVAKVQSLDELEQFESHLIKSDGTTEIREHVKEKPKPSPIVNNLPSRPSDLFHESNRNKLPSPMGVLTRFFKTAPAQVKAYA